MQWLNAVLVKKQEKYLIIVFSTFHTILSF